MNKLLVNHLKGLNLLGKNVTRLTDQLNSVDWDEELQIKSNKTDSKETDQLFFFSSPQHKVLKVSYCDHLVFDIRHASSTISSNYISS